MGGRGREPGRWRRIQATFHALSPTHDRRDHPMRHRRRPGTHRRITWYQIVIERFRYSLFGEEDQ